MPSGVYRVLTFVGTAILTAGLVRQGVGGLLQMIVGTCVIGIGADMGWKRDE